MTHNQGVKLHVHFPHRIKKNVHDSLYFRNKREKICFFWLEILNFEFFKKAAFNIRSPLSNGKQFSVFEAFGKNPMLDLIWQACAHGLFLSQAVGLWYYERSLLKKVLSLWNLSLKLFFEKPSKTRKADASFPGQLAEDFSRHIVTLLRGLILEILSFWKLSRVNLGLCWLWEGA